METIFQYVPKALNFAPFADLYTYRRRFTRVVSIGAVGVGGSNPIRLQSMTTTLTKDVDATVAQAVVMATAGCEIVRVTTPTIEDARAVREIRKGLDAKGIRVPLVADIHFTPAVALEVAEWADKVRINPGNFADSKAFKQREYSDADYARELERIEEVFTPLVLKLKRLGRALRIGTNHGSLSDRILNRFGDTPLGMVEAALEYARICRQHGFHDIVFSMKASNPKVMVQAYRLLVARMNDEAMDYPLHLGVTEAGSGEDGRIKSAAGIGSLLADGLGDTIRVSLTEPPEEEIPVCRLIADPYQRSSPLPPREGGGEGHPPYVENLYEFARRPTREVQIGGIAVGGANPPRVFIRRFAPDAKALFDLLAAQRRAGAGSPELLAWPVLSETDLDGLRKIVSETRDLPGFPAFVARMPWAQVAIYGERAAETADALAIVFAEKPGPEWEAVTKTLARLRKPLLLVGSEPSLLESLASEAIKTGVPGVLIGVETPDDLGALHQTRRLVAGLRRSLQLWPIVLIAPSEPDAERRSIRAGALCGSLLCDGIGDAIVVPCDDPVESLRVSYGVLQAASARITKAEFVSCPGCGRTLFDLQTTTQKIRARTDHLKGVKVAIMGCIVNGPGEMADADFGYVGGGPGRINLYVGKECVEKNIAESEALGRLEALIRSKGRWEEPPPV